MTPRRLLLRILFLVAVLALLLLGGYFAWFQSWRAGQMLDLAARSEVVKLPAGEMEFAVRGSGAPVLIFHSAPGGYDQALVDRTGEQQSEGGSIGDTGKDQRQHAAITNRQLLEPAIWKRTASKQ